MHSALQFCVWRCGSHCLGLIRLGLLTSCERRLRTCHALVIIVQFICRRVADIYFGSRPNDPSRYDEAVEMWIEDCAAKNVLVRSYRVMIRSIQIRIKIVSVSAVCRMASLAKHWCEAVDSTFHGEYFLLFKEVEPSTWDYIKARWVTDCLLYITAESKYLDLLLLTRRRS